MSRASLHAINRRGCGCRSWFGTGLEPECMYNSTARASSSSMAHETYVLWKGETGSRFLRFSHAPLMNPTTESKL